MAHKDLSERVYRPSLEVRGFSFNPIGKLAVWPVYSIDLGRSFAVVSTEGVLIYSIDNHRKFQPRRLVEEVTPKAIENAIQDEKFHKALYMSLILNDAKFVERSLNVIRYDKSKVLKSHLS